MDDERQKKIFLMKIGVVSVTVIILVLWLLNLKNVFSGSSENQASPVDISWIQTRDDFQKMAAEMADRLDKIQTARETASGSALISELMLATSKLASSTNATGTLATSSLDIFTASSTLATSTGSTATTTKNSNKNCPEYLDCMPKIGAAQACQIPAGCEGITKIAY